MPLASIHSPLMDNPFQLLEITPDLAAEFLGKNIDINRSARASKVAQFSRDMKAGKWRLTHQAIAFDWNDQLIDGQHRLKAIVKAGIPIKLWVFKNLDPSSFTVIDSGCARSASDFLKRHGFKNTSTVAAGIRLAIRYKRRFHTSKLHSKVYSLSHSEIERYALDNFDACNHSASFAKSVRNECPSLRAASVAGFSLICRDHKGEDLYQQAQGFLARVAVGAELSNGSAELALRKYITNNSPRTHNLNSTDFSLGLYIKAFNYYLENRPVLSFKPGSLSPFPVLLQPDS